MIHPFYIVGSTGSGKSRLALEIATQVGGEIVNGDAFQIYSGIPTITACPSQEEKARIPHHLYEILELSEPCDAGRYLGVVEPLIAEISGRGKVPIVVGGSGLYLKALTHGFSELPQANPEIRGHLMALSLEELKKLLRDLDPVSAERIDLANRRYVQRAVEITMTMGHPASQNRTSWESDDPNLRGVVLDWHRDELYARINARVPQMFSQGAVAEVAAVKNWSENSEKAIGVREIRKLIAGEIDEGTCIEMIQQASRRYAKRQATWFRREKWLTQVEMTPQTDLTRVAEEVLTQVA